MEIFELFVSLFQCKIVSSSENLFVYIHLYDAIAWIINTNHSVCIFFLIFIFNNNKLVMILWTNRSLDNMINHLSIRIIHISILIKWLFEPQYICNCCIRTRHIFIIVWNIVPHVFWIPQYIIVWFLFIYQETIA